MPFGYGPRSCIGMRLAQMEMRIAAIHIFRKFRFLPCEKTEVRAAQHTLDTALNLQMFDVVIEIVLILILSKVFRHIIV